MRRECIETSIENLRSYHKLYNELTGAQLFSISRRIGATRSRQSGGLPHGDFIVTQRRANPILAKLLLSLAGGPLLRTLNRLSTDARATQQAVLRRILAECKDTVYGREHGFSSIRTIDEYRRAVPISDFEGHRRYVERMCAGERDVLFPGKPLMYNTTSGTTDKPKFIPVSHEYFSGAFQRLSRLWLYAVMRDNPTIYNGQSLSAVAPAVDGHVADGTPHGSISGVTYRSIPGVLKKTYSTPYPIICITDYLKKYYAMMRYALACDITFIVCPSPSNLLRFHQTTMESFGDLVRDIHDGTLRSDIAECIAEADREPALAALKPNRARARHLESLLRTHGEALRPKHYWPDLACVNTWKQGNFALVLPRLDGYFPEKTVLREFGYLASEARAGIVLGNDWTHSVPAAHVYHFEFVPEEERVSPDPRTLLAHELETGKRYYLLFTNGSGLYRYDINDIIEVIGAWNQLPLFRFIQKGEGVTSLTGEKLSEQQVIQAVQDVVARHSVHVEFFRMLCDQKSLSYRLYVEFAEISTVQARRIFVGLVDERLKQINCEYQVKRESHRLAIPQLVEMKPGSAQRFKETLINRRLTTDGQYKETFLTKNPVHAEILGSLAVTGPA